MKHIAALSVLIFLSRTVFAGSLLGGEISYAHLSGLTWSFTVTTYVDPFAPSDMPELFVGGDGAVDTIPRESQTTFLGDCFEQYHKDVYTWQHTFQAPGVYTMSAWKVGRAEALNLSVVPDNVLCLSVELVVTPDLTNSSPVFGTQQLNSYYIDNRFVHDPNVTDADGDSLAFFPHVPQGVACGSLSAFSAPALVTPEGDYTMLDPATGIFQWIDPNTDGEFVVGIRCTEWRNGQMIGSVMRDMRVCLEAPFTAMQETGRSDAMVLQPSLDGPVTVEWVGGLGRSIDLFDPHGRSIERLESNRTRTVLPTDQLATGVYHLRMCNSTGTITTARFVVAR